MTPQRIQRRREAGWRMPEGAVYVGRPTKWGNPFMGAPRAELVARFREEIDRRPDLADLVRHELRGKDLACWCPLDEPCHADVLLEIVNGAQS